MLDDEFHDEILTEIFSRTPAKSVGKFRCLSKTWHTILSTPHFIKLHLSHNIHQESLILLRRTPVNSIHVAKLPIQNPTLSREFQLGNAAWTQVIGSCNGLVLLLNSEEEMFLVNPTTLEQFKIPNLIIEPKTLTSLRGFGYDSYSDDYKILVISRLFSTDIDLICCMLADIDSVKNGVLYSADNYRVVDMLVDLYSVKSGVWRRINHSIDYFYTRSHTCGAFTNSSFHWYISRRINSRISCRILTFNFATEVFHEVDIPLAFPGIAVTCNVFAHEGRLCVLNSLWTLKCVPSGKIDAWMMNEYGVLNSWTKLGSVDGNRKCFIHRPLYFSRDEDILLVNTEKAMLVYNLQGSERAMVVDGVPSILDGCSFVDSLVSLKGITSST